MLQTENKIVYSAFGLRISSEIPLPELPHISEPSDELDIEIRNGDIGRFADQLFATPFMHVVDEGAVMFYVPDTAYYSIRDGRFITVSPVQGADEDLIRLYVLGTCMGALLMQRGILPLHGSAVAIQGKVYAFVGDSGAGKSTLASAFLSQGYSLVSDDLIAVTLSKEDQKPMVTPSYPQQKLWQDSLNHLGMSSSDLRSIYGREDKYCIPVASNYVTSPLPLAGVIELVKTENQLQVVRIEKLDRLQTLFYHTFRPFLIPRLGLMEWHFQSSSVIANQISMYQLSRPESQFTAPQLVNLILDTLSMEA
ncbi:aldolase [Paenibacillus sp. UNC451MF]|uniref:aldolase n=1 Tax=Paenibacillus sp. UNC451MF TaxID=1449063 RepID=UPI0004915894|nr:aldolase [Paenibacillus sp. UNC451MF]